MYIKLNATTPAPPDGMQNVHFRADESHLGTSADPEPVSAYAPNTGGVAVKTANYTLTAADCGKLIVANSATAITFTLPTAIPFGQWNVRIANIGAGALSVVPGGTLTLDGATGPVSATQFQSVSIATDGANYFSARGIGGSGSNATSIQGKPVSATAPTNGQVLQYDATSGLYVPTTPSGGGGGFSLSNFQLYDGTSYWLFPPAFECTVPLAADFSWLRQPTGATETASGGQLALTCPTGMSTSLFRSQAISGKTTLTAALAPEFAGGGATGHNPNSIIYVYESSSGHMLTFNYGYNNGPIQFGVWYLTSPDVFNSVQTGTSVGQYTTVLLKIQISGANLVFSYSINGGKTWLVLFSHAISSFFTTAPDHWGYGLFPEPSQPQEVDLLSWATS